LLEQRQVVQRIKDQIFPFIAPRVHGNALGSATDHYPVDESFDQHAPVSIGGRH
jgi:hypothetical protein